MKRFYEISRALAVIGAPLWSAMAVWSAMSGDRMFAAVWTLFAVNAALMLLRND